MQDDDPAWVKEAIWTTKRNGVPVKLVPVEKTPLEVKPIIPEAGS